MLISLEGPDKVGKTTQCIELKKKLEKMNYKCKIISFPDRNTLTGKIINKFLNGEIEVDPYSLALLFSGNKYEKQKDIKKLINEGYIVILDRYSLSGIIYSCANGVDKEWIKNVESLLIEEDLIFILKNNDSFNQLNFGQEIFEKKDFQIKIEELFDNINQHNAIKIDVSQKTINDVTDDIIKHILLKIKQNK